MLTIEAAFADTSYDMELEKIKNKIQRLYTELLVKTFKAANPNATSEQIENFLEANELEFKGTGFEEEADDLDAMLDLLGKDDELDEIKNKSFEAPDVERGKELKSKSNEKTTAPTTTDLKLPTGGLFKPKDAQSRPKTKSLRIPTGKIKRIIDDAPTVKTKELKDIWEAERSKLLALVEQRNKEFGVIL